MPIDASEELEGPLIAPEQDVVTRNVHGQSLDDARQAFRAEWQAKVDRKRQQAVRARLKAEHFERSVGELVIWRANCGVAGTLFSSLMCCFISSRVWLALGGAAINRKRAQRLEQEARALGYREDKPRGRRRRKGNSR